VFDSFLPSDTSAVLLWGIGFVAATFIFGGFWAQRYKSRLFKARDEELETLRQRLARTERALADQRRRFEDTERISQTGSWTSNLADNTLEASAAYLSIYETRLECIPKTPEEFVARFVEDPPPEVALNIAKLARGESIEGCRHIRLENGKRKWLRFRSEPHFDSAGQLIGYHGIVRDITEEYERAAALTETTSMLKEVQRMAKISHFHWDLASDRLEVADDYFSMLGVSGNDCYQTMKQWIETASHPDDAAEITQGAKKVALGQPYHVVRRSRGSDGHYRLIEVNAVPLRDADGRAYAYRATVRDVTEQQVSLARITQSEARFRHLTELSSDWYWEQDADYRFTFVSREKTIVTGQSRAEVLGKTRWELFPDALSPEEWTAHRAVLAARRPYAELITRVTLPTSGEVVGYFAITGEPVFGPKKTFMGYHGIGKDVTQRKMAEHALMAKSAELSAINRRLTEEVARRQQLERSLMMVVESAMTRAGSELHDELSQDLTGIALMTKALEKRLTALYPDAATDAMRISSLVNRTIGQARTISHGLSPPIVGERGLQSALHQLAADINGLDTIVCRTALYGDVEITDEAAARTLFRIAQDAASHAIRQTRASVLRLSLKRTARGVQFVVFHNGNVERDCDDVVPTGLAERARAIEANIQLKIRQNRGVAVRVVWKLGSSGHRLRQVTNNLEEDLTK
jgi:PAS domain S-box-containing protein